MITDEQILNLKKKATALRDNVIEANATYKEVLTNIEGCEASLKNLGIKDTSKVDEFLKEETEKITNIYNEINEQLNSL